MKNAIFAALALAALTAAEGAAQSGPAVPEGLEEVAPLQQRGRYDDPQDRYGQDQDEYGPGQARYGSGQDRYDYDDYGRRGYQPNVRLWLEDRRTLFGFGDQTRVYLRTDDDAYVAVFHIDTNGDVEVLYPYSSRDDGYVPGRRTFSLSARGASRYLRTRGGYGVGYVFAIASPEPLDLYRVRRLWGARFAGGWDADRSIYGDPFYAIDRITDLIVPDYAYGDHDVDVYTYYVGSSRYTHPRYACYDGYGPWYSSRDRYYDSCDRVRVLLVSRPYYYDTHYYRGSRRSYYDRYYGYGRYYGYDGRRRGGRSEPEHRYKEQTDVSTRTALQGTGRRPSADGGAAPPLRDLGFGQGEQPDPQQQDRRVTPPSRQRPVLQRRPEATEPSTRREPVDRRDAEPQETRRREPVRDDRTERSAPPPRERRADPPPSRPSSSEPRRSGGESRPSSGGERRAEPRSEPRRSEPSESRPSSSERPSRVRPSGS